jgi:hypothetical protein
MEIKSECKNKISKPPENRNSTAGYLNISIVCLNTFLVKTPVAILCFCHVCRNLQYQASNLTSNFVFMSVSLFFILFRTGGLLTFYFWTPVTYSFS